MFKNLKEKKLGDKAGQRSKTSTPQKVSADSSTNENSVDAKGTPKTSAPSDHGREKEVSLISTAEPVTVTQPGNSGKEEPNLHNKVQ